MNNKVINITITYSDGHKEQLSEEKDMNLIANVKDKYNYSTVGELILGMAYHWDKASDINALTGEYQEKLDQRDIDHQTQIDLLNEEIQRYHDEGIKQSKSVLDGHMLEEWGLWLSNFRYNPRDLRIMNNPSDCIIYDGMTAGYIKELILGDWQLKSPYPGSDTKSQIKKAIERKDVRFEILNAPQILR